MGDRWRRLGHKQSLKNYFNMEPRLKARDQA